MPPATAPPPYPRHTGCLPAGVPRAHPGISPPLPAPPPAVGPSTAVRRDYNTCHVDPGVYATGPEFMVHHTSDLPTYGGVGAVPPASASIISLTTGVFSFLFYCIPLFITPALRIARRPAGHHAPSPATTITTYGSRQRVIRIPFPFWNAHTAGVTPPQRRACARIYAACSAAWIFCSHNILYLRARVYRKQQYRCPTRAKNASAMTRRDGERALPPPRCCYLPCLTLRRTGNDAPAFPPPPMVCAALRNICLTYRPAMAFHRMAATDTGRGAAWARNG